MSKHTCDFASGVKVVGGGDYNFELGFYLDGDEVRDQTATGFLRAAREALDDLIKARESENTTEKEVSKMECENSCCNWDSLLVNLVKDRVVDCPRCAHDIADSEMVIERYEKLHAQEIAETQRERDEARESGDIDRSFGANAEDHFDQAREYKHRIKNLIGNINRYTDVAVLKEKVSDLITKAYDEEYAGQETLWDI